MHPHALIWRIISSNWNNSTYTSAYTLWKFRNFTATVFPQKFRQINVLLKEHYYKLIWQKKFAWQRISPFSTLWLTKCGNYENLLSLFFGWTFVKVMVLLTKLANSWFDEFFSLIVNFSFFYRQRGLEKYYKTRLRTLKSALQ